MGHTDPPAPTPAAGSESALHTAGLPTHLQPPPAAGVIAPGGYTVVSPAAGASSSAYPYPPQPSASDPVKPGKHAAAATGPPPAGYPGRAGSCCHAHGYPPAVPTPAYPVTGYPAAGPPGAAPVAGMCMQQQQPGAPCKHRCDCTVGWVLYGVGWIFWPCWVAAMIMPFVTKNRSDKAAAIATAITFGILIVIGIVLAVVFAVVGSKS